jgi:hypothetical protein
VDAHDQPSIARGVQRPGEGRHRLHDRAPHAAVDDPVRLVVGRLDVEVRRQPLQGHGVEAQPEHPAGEGILFGTLELVGLDGLARLEPSYQRSEPVSVHT